MKKLVPVLMWVLFSMGVSHALEGVDSSFYPFARSLAEKYHLPAYRYALPWSRERTALFIRQAESCRDSFSAREKVLLERYRETVLPPEDDGVRRGIVHVRSGKGQAVLTLQGRGGYISGERIEGTSSTLDYILYTGGVRAEASLGAFDMGLSFNDETIHGDMTDLLREQTKSYYDETGQWREETVSFLDLFVKNRGWGWTNLNDDASELYFDRADAYLAFQQEGFSVTAAKGANVWGPGDSHRLFLSSHATSYNQVRLIFDWGPLSLVSVTAGLRSGEKEAESLIEDPGADPKDRYRQKYLAAHRLEFSIAGRHHIAFQEGVIYADKGVQLGYAIPFNFFWSEQHYEGDRDNVIMGADGHLTVTDRLILYGEVLLDDLSVRKLRDFRRTKSAYTLGARIYPPFPEDALFSFGYTRINPLVYTHRYNIDNYTHFGSLLGSSLGPNSDDFRASLFLGLSAAVDVGLHAFFTRSGENYIDEGRHYINVGGDVERPDLLSTDVPRDYAFLGGVRKEILGVSFSVKGLFWTGGETFFPQSRVTVEGGLTFKEARYRRPGDLGEPLYGEGASTEAFVMVGINYGY